MQPSSPYDFVPMDGLRLNSKGPLPSVTHKGDGTHKQGKPKRAERAKPIDSTLENKGKGRPARL